MKSLFDNIKVLASLVPAVRTADVTTGATAVDTLGYNDGMAVVTVGDLDLASTDETYVLEVYECDTSGGTYVATGITLTPSADNDVKVARVANLNTKRKRYLKIYLDVGGTTPSCPVAALMLLGQPYSAPVNS